MKVNPRTRILRKTRRVILIFGIAVLSVSGLSAQNELTNVPSSDPEVEKASLRLSDDLEINLFISDPDIDKPIQMAWDEKGRLWLATSNSYPQPVPGQDANDKIFIVEDLDQDGTADRSTVFKDGLLTPTGIEFGDGGVYVANSTEMIHFSDTDGDRVADLEREVLRGFGADDTHHILHTFNWGPDGKFYMNQSVYIYSHVETPWGVERLRGGGIWRYDTEMQKLEVMARGMWNAWGFVFDKDGQSFATDGAGGDGILPIYPGVAYVPAVGVDRTMKGLNPDSPKYAGLEIISGDHFPADWDGDLITNDFRANKIVRYHVEEDASGYKTTEQEPVVWSDHIAFRPVAISQGPDGALYVADWYNPIIQHGEVDFRDPRRDHQHGRIWRITSKSGRLNKWADLGQLSVPDLLAKLTSDDLWTRKQVRRLLREHKREEVQEALKGWTYTLLEMESASSDQMLEALWLHQSLNTPNESLIEKMSKSGDHRQRRAVARVLVDWGDQIESTIAILEDLVVDEHLGVKREAVNALGGRASFDAAQLAMSAYQDDLDPFMDYELFQALRELEPIWVSQADKLAVSDEALNFALLSAQSEPSVRLLTERYVGGQIGDKSKEALKQIAAKAGSDDLQKILDLVDANTAVGENERLDHLKALETAARGERKPSNSEPALDRMFDSSDTELQEFAARLSGRWKIEAMRTRLSDRIVNTDIDLASRKASIMGISFFKDDKSAAQLKELATGSTDRDIQIAAIQGLAEIDIESASWQAVELVGGLEEEADPVPFIESVKNKRDAFIHLAEAVSQTKIPTPLAQKLVDEYGGDHASRRAFNKALINQGAEFLEPMHGLNLNSKGTLSRIQYSVKAAGSVERGKEIYLRPALMCQSCHVIDGEGGRVGPNLSTIGVQAPADYLIESLVDPGKAIKDAYATVLITENDGTIHMGVARGETSSGITLINAANQELTIPNERIKETEVQPGSLMPAGIISSLDRDEFVDLVAYLSSLGEIEN